MEAFPFAPNWMEPVTERLEWLTDVIEGHDATEERTPLRTLPRRTLEYRLLAPRDAVGLLDALVWRWQADQFVLPIWTDPQNLAAALSAGASTIPVTTTDYDFSAPGYAVLWRSWSSYEVVTVDSLSAVDLTLSSPLAADWPAGTRIYPARLARLGGAAKADYHTAAVANTTLRFEIEPATITAAAGAMSYRSVEVFDRAHNWVEPKAIEYDRKIERFDYDLGLVTVDDLSGLPQTRRGHRVLLRSRADIVAWRGWLAERQGRYAPVWVPSRTCDLEQAQAITSGSVTLKVKALSYEDRYRLDTGRRDLALKHLPTGAWYYRRINAVAAGDPGEENLTLDSSLGVAAALGELAPISWLTLSRLEADAVEIAWHTAGVAECSLNLRSVRE